MKNILKKLQNRLPVSRRRARIMYRSTRADLTALAQLVQHLCEEHERVVSRHAILTDQMEGIVQALLPGQETSLAHLGNISSFVQQLLDQLARARGDYLSLRAIVERKEIVPAEEVNLTPIDPDYSLDRCFEMLEPLAPRACRLWRSLLEVNEDAYHDAPAHNCSVSGHQVAELFAKYLRIYLSGTVLDIGCGPQAVPSYLEHYPLELIAGLDPLAPFESHPFAFAQGVAEFLPWRDNTFDVVVAATSLDHVLLLDVAFEEMIRVLKPGGKFIVWVGFIPGSAPYDPYSEKIEAVDEFHLFHFDREQFERTLTEKFIQIDRFEADPISAFYCFTPRSHS